MLTSLQHRGTTIDQSCGLQHMWLKGKTVSHKAGFSLMEKGSVGNLPSKEHFWLDLWQNEVVASSNSSVDYSK